MLVTRRPLVLVIEDSDARFPMLRAYILANGCRALRAVSAGTALRIIRATRFDLILLDHDLDQRLPASRDLTGFDIARALAAPGPNRRTPVLIHSSNTTRRASMLRFMRANGMDAELLPSVPSGLRAHLQELLDDDESTGW